jgi:hypothetical protein
MGAAAGVLGLEGLQGVLFYLLASLYLSAILYLFQATYTTTKTSTILTDGLASAAQSYVLFWTLFYGIVHIY